MHLRRTIGSIGMTLQIDSTPHSRRSSSMNRFIAWVGRSHRRLRKTRARLSQDLVRHPPPCRDTRGVNPLKPDACVLGISEHHQYGDDSEYQVKGASRDEP